MFSSHKICAFWVLIILVKFSNSCNPLTGRECIPGSNGFLLCYVDNTGTVIYLSTAQYCPAGYVCIESLVDTPCITLETSTTEKSTTAILSTTTSKPPTTTAVLSTTLKPSTTTLPPTTSKPSTTTVPPTTEPASTTTSPPTTTLPPTTTISSSTSPPTTTVITTTVNPGVPCTEPGVYPGPQCNQYYLCVPVLWYLDWKLYNCTTGQAYNPAIKGCDLSTTCVV